MRHSKFGSRHIVKGPALCSVRSRLSPLDGSEDCHPWMDPTSIKNFSQKWNCMMICCECLAQRKLRWGACEKHLCTMICCTWQVQIYLSTFAGIEFHSTMDSTSINDWPSKSLCRPVLHAKASYQRCGMHPKKKSDSTQSWRDKKEYLCGTHGRNNLTAELIVEHV